MSTILIVEDDVNINEMLKVALQKEDILASRRFQGQRADLYYLRRSRIWCFWT